MSVMDSPDSPDILDLPADDPPEIDSLYNQNARAVTVYFIRCGFGQAQAEDMVQEVFLRASRSVETYDSAKGNLRTWLWTIARNLARREWSRRRSSFEHDMELAELALEERGGPGEALASTEETRAVAACVQALRGELGKLVRMRYVDGLTTRGIAQAANLPEATVRARLSEALSLLEKCLRSKGVISS